MKRLSFLFLLLSFLASPAWAYLGSGSNTVLLMHFNEGDGQNVYDESPNGLNGIRGNSTANATNDPTWVTPPSGCRFGNCFDFNDDWVRVTDNNALDITGNLTVEAWVASDNTDTDTQTFVSKWRTDSVANSSYWLHVDSSNDDVEFCLSDGTTATCVDTNDTGTVCTNVFATNDQIYHVAGTFNASNRQQTIWVNGIACASITGPVAINASTTDLLIGSVFTGAATIDTGNGALDGRIDEVRIRNTIPLDSDQTAEYFNPGPVVNAITYAPAAGDDSFRIYNGGGATINVSGWVFQQCSTTNNYVVPAGANYDLSPGEVVTVTVRAAAGTDTAATWFTANGTGANDMTSLTATDCLRVYGQATTTDATSIIDFVAWGGDAGTGDDQAVTAGLWGDGTNVSTLPIPNRQTIQLYTTEEGTSTRAANNEEGVLDWKPNSYMMVRSENAPRASGDYYSANNGGGRNIPYDFFIEVPVSAPILRVEIFDADVGAGPAGETTANRDRTQNTYDTTVTYRLINPAGTTVATFNGTAAAGTDNTFMTPDGFRVASPANGRWRVQVDATVAGDDIDTFALRAQGFQIYTNYLGIGANSTAFSDDYVFYPWVHSGCTFNLYDFDHDSAQTTTQFVQFDQIFGNNAYSQTVPDASLSDQDVWARNILTGYTNDQDQTNYGAVSMTGNIIGYAGGGNYAILEFRNFNGGTAADAGDADTDTNVLPMYLSVNDGGPPNVPYTIQTLNVVSGPATLTNGMTTRIQVEIAALNFTGENLNNVSLNTQVAASIGGNVTITYQGNATVTQGSITAQPVVGSTGGGGITWNVGTLLGSGTGGALTYQIDVLPIGGAARKVLTGTPAAANGTRFTFDRDSHDTTVNVTETVGPICELAVTTGSATATYIELSSLNATPYNDAILLEWVTGTEIDNLGFNVFRSTSPNGNFVQINNSFIPGLLTAAGGSYYFVDQDVTPGQTYYYLLEDVDTSGVRTQHGPVSAFVDAAFADFASSGFNPLLYTSGGWWSGEAGSGGSSGSPPVPVPPVNIVQTSDDIIITLYPEAPVLTPIDHEGETYEQVAVTGYVATGVACKPQLPERTLLVNLPDREVTFSVDSFATATLSLISGEEVYPQPQYQMNELGTGLDAVFCQDASAYQVPTPVSMDAAVEWLGDSWSGGNHLASVRVHPVYYSPIDGTLTYATQVVLRLHLGDPLTPPPSTSASLSDDLDQHFAVIANANAYKIRITTSGLYRLDRDTLQAAGFAVNTDPRDWQVYYHGREQSIFISGEEDGFFDAGDELLFYAQANPDEQAELQNTYWLVPGQQAGLRMAAKDATPDGGALAETYFWNEKIVEENHIYYSTIPNGAGRDHWFWQYAFAPASPAFPVQIDGLATEAASDALLTVHLQGVTTYAEVSPDHHAIVLINGYVVGDFTWDGQTELVASVSVPLAWLYEGANTLQVQLPGDLSVAYDASYIDKFILTYPRHFESVSDALDFWTELYGDHLISGFSAPDVAVVDLTEDPETPEFLTGLSIESGKSGFDVRFKAPDHAFGGVFVAASVQGLPFPDALAPHLASTLRDPLIQANYLLIAAPEFLASAQLLADYRQSQGYQTLVASSDDVYNEFGYGVKSPTAIRDFLRYAYSHWALPPQYVVLVGDGTYDSKNYLGTFAGNENFIPVPLVETSFLQAGSDPWYGLMDENNLIADLYIGRLPVSDVTTLERIITRVIAYETTPDSLTWERKITLIQDNVEPGNEGTDNHFAQTVAAIGAKIPSEYAQQLISEEALGGIAQAQQAILDGLNAGTLIANYVGHGSIQLWAGEQLFQNSSVASLTNENQLPLVVAMNCLNNYFFFPGFTSLAETMLNAPNGGAIAFWSSTGLSTPDWQQILNVGFYESIFAPSALPVKLGPAVHAASLTLAGHPEASDVLQTFSLLGDPALALKIPVQAPSGGSSSVGSAGSSLSSISSDSSSGGCRAGAASHTMDIGFFLVLLAPLMFTLGLKRHIRSA